MAKRARRSSPLRPAVSVSSFWDERRRYVVALGAIVLGALAVRLACSRGDLWLDEIRTLRLLEQIRRPSEILTVLFHDNNHPLNSLFLFLLGPARSAWQYRLFSVISGVCAVAAAASIGQRQCRLLISGASSGTARLYGLVAACAVAFSYLLIHYSSEARGYGPVVCFSLVALAALLRSSERPWSVWAVVYWIACALGLLSHLTMLHVMAGGLAWSLAGASRPASSWRARALETSVWHGVPFAGFAAYYVLFVRHVVVGGGPIVSLLAVLEDLSATALGVPIGWNAAALALASVVFVAALWRVWKAQRALASFYVVACVAAPLLSANSSQFVLLFPRYFIVAAACFLLLASVIVADWCRSPRLAAPVAAGVLFGLGNGLYTADLIRYGRGEYVEGLQYVADHTAAPVATIASDHDFRNGTVIDYYAPRVRGAVIRYVGQDALPPGGTDWLFLHRLDGEPPPGERIAGPGGRPYALERVFRHAVLSGWDWYVYKRQ